MFEPGYEWLAAFASTPAPVAVQEVSADYVIVVAPNNTPPPLHTSAHPHHTPTKVVDLAAVATVATTPRRCRGRKKKPSSATENQMVGFTQYQSRGRKWSPDWAETVTYCMFFHVPRVNKMFHLFFKVGEATVHVSVYTRTCTNRQTFVEELKLVKKSLQHENDDDVRSRIHTWGVNESRAHWELAKRSIAALVRKQPVYPWNAMRVALDPRLWPDDSVTMTWREMLKRYEPPALHTIKFVYKNSNVGIEELHHILEDVISDKMVFYHHKTIKLAAAAARCGNKVDEAELDDEWSPLVE